MGHDEYILSDLELKVKLDYYKSKLSDKYNRANTHSKKKMLYDELLSFSEIYKYVFGDDVKLDWDDDLELIEDYEKDELMMFSSFVDAINANNDFYLNLSNSVINSFVASKYPFYKFPNNSLAFNPRLGVNTMMNYIYSFLKSFDYEMYNHLKSKVFNLEILQVNLGVDLSGSVCKFPTLNKSFILLNTLLKDNVFKFETIVHEFGHSFEMQMFLDSDNNFLSNKSLETPFYEVPSSFFEYAFLNFLKENKIYTNFVDQCLDNYYKELISYMFHINLFSKDVSIQLDENCMALFNSYEYITYGDSIKNRLNYYGFPDYDICVNFKQPYIYGLGALFSVYLYDNYKSNPDFLSEFKKSLLTYPLTNDISAFYNVGISEDVLLNGNVLTKVLSKQSSEWKKD